MQELIRKQTKNDCGPCAVANVLACDWHAAVATIWPKVGYRTTTKQLAQALFPKQNATLIRAYRWSDIPDRSVVKVVQKETKNWHWVAWIEGQIYDNELTRPFRPLFWSNLRPHLSLRSYIGVR